MDTSLPDMRRRFEEEARRREHAERERNEFASFALAGQAAAGLAHELNNLLNTIVLQASVLQLQVDEKLHPALDVIRKQANTATGLLRTLAHASAERAKNFCPVDLNRAVQEVLAEQAPLTARVQWVPANPGQPCIRGVTSAVKQVVRLLLDAASDHASSALRARGVADAESVQLIIESEETPEAPVDAAFLWSRLCELEQLAVQSLLRQLDGDLRVTARPGGGYFVRVAWKPMENP